MILDIHKIKQEFPILNQQIQGQPLVYLDTAATAQQPRQVLEAIKNFYENDYANVHRGVHTLSIRSTDRYESVREQVRKFISAHSIQEIIFTKGTTESINLVASSFANHYLKPGDEVLISAIEHHSNIVPWQNVCEKTGALLKVIPVNAQGDIEEAVYIRYLTDKVKLLALTHVSNAIGTINPIQRMIQLAKEKNIIVLIDGAQAVPHLPVNVVELNCDFYAFSSHKMYGPTGVGILYAKKALLEQMPPYQFGGDMIKMVSFDKTVYNDLPYKFEAGTPNIAGVIGLGAAIDFINRIGLNQIAAHEHRLVHYAIDRLSSIDEVSLVAKPRQLSSLISFVMRDVHPHDIGTIFDQCGVAIRTGHHCAMPLMNILNLPATARLSVGIYNTQEDIDRAMLAIDEVKRVFYL